MRFVSEPTNYHHEKIQYDLCHYLRRFTLLQPVITPSHQLRQDLGLSEYEYLETIVFLELQYQTTLPDDVLTPALTVGELSQLINCYASA